MYFMYISRTGASIGGPSPEIETPSRGITIRMNVIQVM